MQKLILLLKITAYIVGALALGYVIFTLAGSAS